MRSCSWVDDGVPCPNPLPYPGAKGHGHLCDKHVAAELALFRAAKAGPPVLRQRDLPSLGEYRPRPRFRAPFGPR